MSKSALREARAWREMAERIEGEPPLRLYAALPNDGTGIAAAARLRAYDQNQEYDDRDEYWAMTTADRVLFCLFMALECEDESRAVSGDQT